MEIKPEHQQRLSAALQHADEAFWARIAESFPEAKTGDFPPEVTYRRDYKNSEDVILWLHYNAPQLVVGCEGVSAQYQSVGLNYRVHFDDGSSVTMFGTHDEVFAAYPSAIKIEEA